MKSIKTLLHLKKEDNSEEERIAFWRSTFFLFFIFFSFIIIFFRLYFLQVIKGQEYRTRSDKNRITSLHILPSRGNIFDRNGLLIAGSRPSFNVALLQKEEETKNIEAVFKKLMPLLKIDEIELRQRLSEGKNLSPFRPIVLKKDIDWDTLSKIEANLQMLPGIFIEVVPSRYYPNGSLASHLIGYLGEINQEEYEKRKPFADLGDYIGRTGVESYLNDFIEGKKGKELLEINVKRYIERILDTTKPVSGHDVYLTIDMDLQIVAEEAMKDKVGAIVAIEPETGYVRALVSNPEYDIEKLNDGISKEEWEALTESSTKPLLNRAVQGSYAPGSTFKIVLATAALQEGLINKDSSFSCSGSMTLGNRRFRCWRPQGHGNPDLHRAIVESCDIYFGKLGLKLGIENIHKYAKKFGLGEKTGQEIFPERSGLIPNQEWKRTVFKDGWREGDTLNVSIGQGAVSVTPLQMARMMAAVSNGGSLCKPIFVQKITDGNGKTIKEFKPVEQGKLNISSKNLAIINEALHGVVNEPHGTGKVCKIEGLDIGGKTGTAQVVRQTKRRQDEKMSWELKDHAWFVSYATSDHTSLAVAVLVEHGGHGGEAAAPIAKKIFERWFKLQLPRERFFEREG